MEFSEKLQQLRKQNNLTQEQLAERLFVSRTAVSKWENGKGYPNIESLKSISKIFIVSIDELLSGEELIELAVAENDFNILKIYDSIYALLDLMVIAFIVLPLYGKQENAHIYAVNLFGFTDTTPGNRAIYWVIFVTIILLGIIQLVLGWADKKHWEKQIARCSYIIEVIAICFFAAAREPYVTIFLFLFLMIKTIIRIRGSQIKGKIS